MELLFKGVVLGFGLLVGVWLLLAIIDWLGNMGQEITEDEARLRIRRSLEKERRRESGSVKGR